MNSLFAQIVITIWMSAHPVRYMLPKIYFNGEHACESRASQLAGRVKPSHTRVMIGCEPTDKRGI